MNNFPSPIKPGAGYEQLIERWREKGRERQAIHDLYDSQDKTDFVQTIKPLIVESTLLSEEEKRALLDSQSDAFSDIDYYVKNKKFRRLEVWLSPDESA